MRDTTQWCNKNSKAWRPQYHVLSYIGDKVKEGFEGELIGGFVIWVIGYFYLE